MRIFISLSYFALIKIGNVISNDYDDCWHIINAEYKTLALETDKIFE